MATVRSSHALAERSIVGPVTHVRISGIIDETFSPKTISADLTGHVILDLGRLERISSFGVRQWMEFTRTLPPGATDLYVVNAPPIVVDQLAMVDGFAGVARILSMLAPYVCDACEEERVRLIDLRTDSAIIAANEAPAHVCGVCGTKLRFNDSPAQYFAHARLQPLVDVAPAVDGYLNSLRPVETDLPQQHLKIVEGDISFIRLAGKLDRDLNVRRLAGGLQGRVAFDFAHVNGIDDGGTTQLAAMLNAAAKEAVVFLWRVPLFILKALSRIQLEGKIGLATLWLTYECRNCGQRLPQRMLAHEQATSLGGGEMEERPCGLCGGAARAPSLQAVQSLLLRLAVHNAPFDELDLLEPRALSQSLNSIAGVKAEHTPSKSPGELLEQVVSEGVAGPKLQILKRIGQGGMAEVFLARQLGLKGFEKYVVLKKILPQFAGSQHFIDMLFAEARSSARLTHPNIVQIYDVGELQGSAYITMEHVRGPDLRRLMVLLSKASLSLPLEHSLRIVSEIAAGLNYAHSYVDPTGAPHPVIHRDVSPHNILISLDGAIKLSDFGIAKALGESETTQPGMIKGKVAYIPPESVKGEPVDGRGDVFSLGVVLFELLTGKTPFRRESDVATLQAIVTMPPPNPVLLNPKIHPSIAAVMLKALEKQPENRFQTAGEFRLEIEEVMSKNGLRSAPDRVADYFKEKLGDNVVEFRIAAPVNLATPSGSPPKPGHVSKTAVPPPLPSPEAPGTNSPGTNDSISLVFEELLPGHIDESTKTSAPNLNAVGLPTPAPIVKSSAPSPVPKNRQVPWMSAASSQKLVALKAAIEAPPAAAHPLDEPDTGPGLITTVKKKRGWIGAAAAAGLAFLAIVGVVRATTGLVEVVNLAADERVYLNGLRVDATQISPDKSGEMVLAIAKDGILKRFGKIKRSRSIDSDSLPLARADLKDRANLWVGSDPKGCEVMVDGAHTLTTTPLAMEIKAGQELLVEVMCPGLPRRTQWVLAAPGQEVQVSARMFDEHR